MTQRITPFLWFDGRAEEAGERLGEGGAYEQCAWLRDKFGISWQIVPTALGRLMGDPDPVKSQRVMQAMLQMTKIDIQGLQDAYDGPAR